MSLASCMAAYTGSGCTLSSLRMDSSVLPTAKVDFSVINGQTANVIKM